MSNDNTKARYQARARILKALAHPSRLLMVDELSRRELSVAQLTELVGADISTVSKHLSVLKGAGLVEGHKQGNQVIYRLRTPCVMDFFGCLEDILQANLQAHLEVVK